MVPAPGWGIMVWRRQEGQNMAEPVKISWEETPAIRLSLDGARSCLTRSCSGAAPRAAWIARPIPD